jgi:hypothetical protein
MGSLLKNDLGFLLPIVLFFLVILHCIGNIIMCLLERISIEREEIICSIVNGSLLLKDLVLIEAYDICPTNIHALVLDTR